MTLMEISQQLLKASKSTNSIIPLLNQLEKISLSQLQIELNTDAKRKTFWINIYNAFAIIYLKPNPNIILKSISRKRFFNTKHIQMGECLFSLNDVEHQILRKSKIWWGKGYLSKIFIKPCFKKLRVNNFDPRIHFALNCGGLGCPPIRYYEADLINEQLDIATQAFLYSETNLDLTKNEIKVSRLFSWYVGDFGGNKGIITFLKKHNIIKTKENPKIIYSPYNWNPWIK